MVKREPIIQPKPLDYPMAGFISSGDTIADPTIDAADVEPTSQSTILDEGYQTAQVGKEHSQMSSGMASVHLCHCV